MDGGKRWSNGGQKRLREGNGNGTKSREIQYFFFIMRF